MTPPHYRLRRGCGTSASCRTPGDLGCPRSRPGRGTRISWPGRLGPGRGPAVRYSSDLTVVRPAGPSAGPCNAGLAVTSGCPGGEPAGRHRLAAGPDSSSPSRSYSRAVRAEMPVSANMSRTWRNASCCRIGMPAAAWAAREQARWAWLVTSAPAGRARTGQFGQQGLAMGPAVPRAVGATAFVEILGDHLAAAGGYDRTAQGQLPVPVCLAVRCAGGMGGPAVEHHRCSTGQGASASSGRVACQERRQVICGPPGRVRPPAGAGSRHLFSILSVRLMGRAGQADREPGRHGRGWSTVVPGLGGWIQVRFTQCGLPFPGHAAAWPGQPGLLPGVSSGSAGLKVTSTCLACGSALAC